MPLSASQFNLQPSSGVPIYRQLMDQVSMLLVGGQAQPGDMLPSVRELGAALDINMMTVSKAYARLEAEGIVRRVRGQGMVLCDWQPRGSVAQRSAELRPLLEQAVIRGRQLGLSDQHIRACMESALKVWKGKSLVGK
ncbi:MAG: GntR family transcriptional regulator [Pirellulaceae bacterium]|nr:GntR family transcriptional regulator [Pirellulaceae bacterium]